MARGSKKKEDVPQAVQDYYKLKTKAVDDLVTADVSNSPKVSEEELAKYRSGPKIKMTDTVKAILIKAWFAGSVCFFLIWGTSAYLGSQIDLLFVTGFALGLIIDLLENSILRFFAVTPGANDRYMMFPKKAYSSLFFNLIYGYVLLFLVFTTYNVINIAVLSLTGGSGEVPLGVGPILFGVFTMAWDFLLITMKHTAINIFRDARSAQKTG